MVHVSLVLIFIFTSLADIVIHVIFRLDNLVFKESQMSFFSQLHESSEYKIMNDIRGT